MRAALASILGAPGFRPWKQSNNVAHYEADYRVFYAGGEITSWGDTNGRTTKDLVTPTGAGMVGASYVPDDGDGRPAVHTNGTNEGLESLTWNAFDPDSNFTIALLHRRTGTTDAVLWGYGDHLDGLGRVIVRVPAGGFPGHHTGQMFSTTSASDETSNTNQSLNAWQISWFRRSGANFYTSMDGGAEDTKAVPAGAYNMQKFFLAHVRVGAGGSNFTTGRFRALSVYNADLGAPNSTERARLRSFWQARWPGVV